MDRQLFRLDSTAAGSGHIDPPDLRQSQAAEVQDRPVLDQWHDHRQGESLPSDSHQDSGQRDVGDMPSRQDSMGLSRRRGPPSRWQWTRQIWGSRPSSSSAAEGSAGNNKQQRTDSANQREVLSNVKAVVPYLSDEVILAELERTLDANQAVENLLSRM